MWQRPLLVAVSVVSLAGCGSAGAQRCEIAEQCVQDGTVGTCEVTGFCSFPDTMCPSGRKYSDRAGDSLAGFCVGSEVPVTTTGSTDDGTMTSSDTLPADVGPAPIPWWDCRWDNRRQIQIDGEGLGEDLQGVPVLILLDGGRIDYAQTAPGGVDLRFLADDGETVLPHEIERWDPSGLSSVWIRVPQLSAAAGARITLYYDHPEAPPSADPAAVWSSEYAAVLHLEGAALDSAGVHTGRDNDTVFDVGQIAGGRFFATSANIDLAAAEGIDDVFAGGGSFAAWVRASDMGEGGEGRIAQKSTGSAATDGWTVLLSDPEQALMFTQDFDGNRGLWRTPDGSIAIDDWHYVVVVYDATLATNTPSIYIDGVLQPLNEVEAPMGMPLSDAGTTLRLGAANGNSSRDYRGRLDEIRLSHAMRSAAWIAFQHRVANDAVLSFAPVETKTCP